MAGRRRPGVLDARYSEAVATATPWRDAQRLLEQAGIYWLATVRPDGRPHTTPLIAVWLDGAAYVCTGADERKARNLAANAACTLTTGVNELALGLDVVIEGDAHQVHDYHRLRTVAAAYLDKYGEEWAFSVDGGAFTHADGGRALVFEIVPTTVFAFARGVYGQTRWRFGSPVIEAPS